MDGGFVVLFVGLVFLAVALVIIGIGIVIGIGILLLTTVLVLLGIISSSAVIGLVQKRFEHGFFAFVVQLGGISGIPVGVGVLLILDWLIDWSLDWRLASVFGAFTGLIGGVLLGVVFSLITLRTYRWISQRILIPDRLRDALDPRLRGNL